MNADEVLERLSPFGFKASTKSLYRYQEAGLVPKAKVLGKGQITEYDTATPAQFYASYRLVNKYWWKVKLDRVPEVRKAALRLEEDTWDAVTLRTFIASHYDKIDAVWRWLADKARIEESLYDQEKLGVVYELGRDGRLIRFITSPNRFGFAEIGIR